MDRIIFLVDIQSFYASVEKADHPELRDKPVVVSGDPARRSGVILAACPLAKAYGIENAQRLWEALQKCPHVTVVRPRMQRYIDVSLQITEILERFSDLVEPYSVDEQFLDVTGSQSMFGNPIAMARRIQAAIRAETGTTARVGIGPNKVLAKMACDNFAKRSRDGIFWLTRDRLPSTLWPLPLKNMFGVGSRMERRLRDLGLRTIGDLANYPLHRLRQRWGIPGHILWMTANGIDPSPVSPQSHEKQKVIGHHMTLPRDYHRAEEIKVVLLELTEEVCRRARSEGRVGRTVSVGCGSAHADASAGFHRQTTLAEPTHATMEVFPAVWRLFLAHWDRTPVRRVGVSLSNLHPDAFCQLALLHDRVKMQKLGHAMDAIKRRYGGAAIVRALSLGSAGQAFDRAQKIGGHYR